MIWVEQAVRGLPRYHKFTLGSDLRRQAMEIVRLIQLAKGLGAYASRHNACSVEVNPNSTRRDGIVVTGLTPTPGLRECVGAASAAKRTF